MIIEREVQEYTFSTRCELVRFDKRGGKTTFFSILFIREIIHN